MGLRKVWRKHRNTRFGRIRNQSGEGEVVRRGEGCEACVRLEAARLAGWGLNGEGGVRGEGEADGGEWGSARVGEGCWPSCVWSLICECEDGDVHCQQEQQQRMNG